MSRRWHGLLHTLCTVVGRHCVTPDFCLAALVALEVQILQVGQALNRLGLGANWHVTFLEEALDDLRNVVQVIRSLNLCVLIVVACVIIKAGSFVLSELEVTVRADVFRLDIGHGDLLLNLLPLGPSPLLRLVQVHLGLLDVAFQLFFALFDMLEPLSQLLNRLVFVANQGVDQILLVVLLCLLLVDVLDPLVHKLDLLTKLFALGVLRVVIPAELGHE